MAKTKVAQFPKETDSTGRFVRQQSKFRRWVKNSPDSEFPAEKGRYHLYVSLACPWAHRTIIFRKLLGLEDVISMTIVDPIRDERGWAFTDEPDPLNGFRFLKEAYEQTDPGFSDRVTVPVLWDKKTNTIVNNESSEIIRMLNSEFREFSTSDYDFYPEALREQIDAVNNRVYNDVNNGVYRCGFASTQEAYDQALEQLFDTLSWLDHKLSTERYLVGDQLTEADWRLFTTLVRFDPVYVTHFKTNLNRIVDFQHLWAYTRELYQHPGVSDTVNFDHIKRHYFVTHKQLNPLGIVPRGPELNWLEPHGRA